MTPPQMKQKHPHLPCTGYCLVERAAPEVKDKISVPNVLEKINSETDPNNNNNKENIEVSEDGKPKKESDISGKKWRRSGRVEPSSPTEFFHMGSLKSHAMAGKTQTATKLAGNGTQLMEDLLAKGSPPASDSGKTTVEELAESLEKVDIQDPDKKDLIGRGPVRASRTMVTPMPYPQLREQQIQSRNCMVSPQQHWHSQKNRAKPGYSPCGYGGYVGGNNYCDGVSSVPLEEQSVMISAGGDLFNEGYAVPSFAVNQPLASPSAMNYSPCSGREDTTPPCPTYAACSGEQVNNNVPINPFADGYLNTDELNRLLNVPEELPEALSDFILKYSRRYSTDTPPTSYTPDSVDSQPSSRKNSASDSSTSGSPKHFRPRSSTDDGSVCDSPMSAGSAPQRSPAAPKGGQTPGTPMSLKQVGHSLDI